MCSTKRKRGNTTKTYHICAITQQRPGEVHYYDGLIHTDDDLTDYAEYEKVKRSVGEAMNPPVPGPKVTIISLTRITN